MVLSCINERPLTVVSSGASMTLPGLARVSSTAAPCARRVWIHGWNYTGEAPGTLDLRDL